MSPCFSTGGVGACEYTHLAVLPPAPANETGKRKLIVVCLHFLVRRCTTVGPLSIGVPALQNLLLLCLLLLRPVLPRNSTSVSTI